MFQHGEEHGNLTGSPKQLEVMREASADKVMENIVLQIDWGPAQFVLLV